MWQAISQQLSDVLMFEFKIMEKTRISSGDISESYMISDGEQRYFVKINGKEFLSNFSAEVDDLAELRDSNTVTVPEIVHLGSSKDASFLILNYLPTRPLAEEKSSYQFGKQLAELHLWGDQKEFGFDNDNYIGSTLQPNRWQKKWCQFFAEQRIGWQLQLLKEKGIEFGDIDEIIDSVKYALASHKPKPSLLHGDIWYGNCAESPFGPICYDPACYWGDSECDLAMTELFGGFPPAFYEGYQSVLPIKAGYEDRKSIYNLYHVLNHCNLFGGHYLQDAQVRIDKLIRLYA
ncbi:ribulosamine/erythrulosamine 3-kinase [Vibrio ishigakensis]|uniref:Ribulosamine/erythrulosamine 3-kinase n=1 Tax=Vibrio ishigakensis TaxID=1481914 RepID=A0A0B8QF62_9VIBR|nr:ribulosamine/erythrulosamine 3-kinase [Vibrio ishigakensis]